MGENLNLNNFTILFPDGTAIEQKHYTLGADVMRQYLSTITGVKKEFCEKSLPKSMEFCVSAHFKEWIKLTEQNLQSKCINEIKNISFHCRPKRLPRKMKKLYKKGNLLIKKRLENRYPYYNLKNCRFRYDDSSKLTSPSMIIEYDDIEKQ